VTLYQFIYTSWLEVIVFRCVIPTCMVTSHSARLAQLAGAYRQPTTNVQLSTYLLSMTKLWVIIGRH